MTEAVVGAIAALIGAAFGFGAAWYSAEAQRRLEYARWLRSREDAVHQDIRIAVADVVTRLSELAHSIMWFTFSSLNSIQADQSSEDVERLLDSFMDETHSLVAQIVGAQYRLAALHLEVYETVTPLVSEAIRLSEDAIFAAEREVDVDKLRRSNQAALTFIKKLPKGLGGLIASIESVRERPASRGG